MKLETKDGAWEKGEGLPVHYGASEVSQGLVGKALQCWPGQEKRRPFERLRPFSAFILPSPLNQRNFL